MKQKRNYSIFGLVLLLSLMLNSNQVTFAEPSDPPASDSSDNKKEASDQKKKDKEAEKQKKKDANEQKKKDKEAEKQKKKDADNQKKSDTDKKSKDTEEQDKKKKDNTDNTDSKDHSKKQADDQKKKDSDKKSKDTDQQDKEKKDSDKKKTKQTDKQKDSTKQSKKTSQAGMTKEQQKQQKQIDKDNQKKAKEAAKQAKKNKGKTKGKEEDQQIVAASGPQQKISKDLFTALPATDLQNIDIARGGDDPLIFGLTKDGKLSKLNKDWNGWSDISPKTALQSFSVGADGTMWGLDKDGNCWYQEEGQTEWGQISTKDKKFAQLHVGNKNEVWARDTDNNIWRKKNPVTEETEWQKVDGQGVYIACGGDGKVLLASNDQVLRTFNRFKKTWENVIRPATFDMGNPQKISIKDKFNTLFVNYQNKALKLSPGKSGKLKTDWIEVESATGSFKDIAIGYDGTIVAIDNQGRLIVSKPSKDDIAALEKARGPEIRGTQIVRLIGGPNVDFMRVWTHADSYYDQNAQEDPPNNFNQLLVGSSGSGSVTIDIPQVVDTTTPKSDEATATEKETKKILAPASDAGKKLSKASAQTSDAQQKQTIQTQDKRQDIGCFFSITPAGDDNSNSVINFGDSVTIWSLYAAEGNLKKAGSLSKEWKWWVSDSHFLWKQEQLDLRVSLLNHPHAQDGWQTFKLISPYNQTGPIRSNDTVIIQSVAPQAQERNLWVNQYSWVNAKEHFEILVAAKNTGPWQPGFYGQQDLGGAQYFTLQAVNSEADIPDTGISLNTKDPKKTARNVFSTIKGTQFWFDKTLATATVAKSLVKSELTAGLGVVRELRNNTDYPITTNNFGTCPTRDSITNKKYELIEPLILEGFAKEPPITDFGPDRMITLNKMFSKGFAWLDTALEKPGQATVTFLARATDNGGIEVAFNTRGDTQAKWHIIIGGNNNTTSQILLDGKLIAEAPLARAIPGRFIPYWISINKGSILVGIGTPGTSIFMSAYMPEDTPVNRVGFSSHDAPVDYTEIKVGQALHTIADDETYAKVNHDITLPAGGDKVDFIDIPVRLPNEASIAFTAQAKHDLSIVLQNKKGDNKYKVVIGAQDNKLIKIERNGTIVHELITEQLPIARLSQEKPTDFWVSILGGALMVGQGKLGDNLLLAWQDPDDLEDITQLGFQPSDHEQKITNIEIAPPVTIGVEKTPITYAQQVQRFPYKGTMSVHRPFRYDFIQTDQRVTMKDMISGKTFSVLSTPQQQAEYVFLIDIDEIGLPTIQLMQQPEDAPGKIALEKGAILQEIEANRVAKIADAKGSIMEAAGQATLQAAGSFAMSPNMIMALGGLALSGAGIGLATGAAAIKSAGQIKAAEMTAQAQKMRTDAQFGFRAHNSYNYVEQPTKEFGALETVPAAAQQNAATVAQLLGETKKFIFSDPSHFSILLKIYIDILRNITHPFVVDSEVVKVNIFDDLDQIRQYYPNNPEQLMVVLDVLVRAYSNSYLVDAQIKRDVAAKDRWYFTMADIGKTFLNASLQDPDFAFTLPPLFGEYIWIPWELKTPNLGWIIFEVQGQSDAFVCFSEDAVSVRNTDAELYETVIGGWENSKDVIRIKSLGRSASETDITKNLRSSQLSQREFRAYWIGFNDGMISVGSGDEIGKNIITQWQDPYPWKTMKFVGISTWDVPLQFRNIYTLEGLEALKTMQVLPAALPVQPQALSEQEQAALAAYQGAQAAGPQNIAQQQDFKTAQAQGYAAQEAYYQGDTAQTGYLAPRPGMMPGMGMSMGTGYPATGYPQPGYPAQPQMPIMPPPRTR
ncbi:hypothetical protein K2X40_01240 [Candidatus Babeliales bacterium]|nr:hypothetical protein [Candidatus Babeliales bacterium]